MSFVLNAYSSHAYQEFILPETDNANYDAVLDRSIFALREDVGVHFEVVGGVWRYVGMDRAAVSMDRELTPGRELRDGDSFSIAVGQVGVTLRMTRFQPSLAGLKKYRLPLPCQIHIGQAEDNEIRYLGEPLASQSHAVLTVNAGSCVVTDVSTNGVFVGARRIHGACSLDFGECVQIFGLQIVWLGDVLAVGCKGGTVDCRLPEAVPTGGGEGVPPCREAEAPCWFRRSPRNMPRLYDEKLEIEAPPQPQRSPKRPLLLTIGPSLTMALPMVCGMGMAVFASRSSGSSSGMFLYTGVVIAVMSALIGTMWALINLRYAKKTERQNERARVEKYREYLHGMEEEIAAKYDYNTQSLRYLYPPAADCARYGFSSPELWSRNMSHRDFLYLRLGLGTRPFQCEIAVPKRRFSLIDDELAAQPQRICDRFKNLKDVPVGIDLWADRLVGVVGGPEEAVDIMRLLAVQAAANTCYTDVKMVFLFDGRTPHVSALWAFARWFPHVWSEDKRVRFFAADQSERSEVCYALANVFRARAEEGAQPGGRKTVPRPHYMVFVERAELLEGEPVAKYLLDPEEHLGVSTVLLAERFEQLPNSCVHIIENDAMFRGVFNTETGDGERQAIEFDPLSPGEAERFARGLSGIEVGEAESGGEIPASLTFLEMYRVSGLEELNAADRWRKNRTYEHMRALVGRKSGGADWYLDVHEKYHGPHGLVAGTTGSGKSETLQTYILSLAVNFSPEDVAFFLIDFKGGGMANLFADLPHTAGHISNLSGNQIHRAMVSIKSENRRRQRLFGEFGVNHIDQYTRLVKNGEAGVPIPHLFIVIDEFAELKRDEPDFMRELISVAQVGRSLGVHLILATQKPGGTVDDNIWSNTRFRLCLRVQDRQDSTEMLHKPDAAYITQAGRCYMQVGNDEIYELFQSGWSGAVYEADGAGAKAEQVTMWGNTGRSAFTGGGNRARRAEARRLEWLTALAQCLDGAAAGAGLSLADCLEREETARALLDAAYAGIKEAGYDFPPGKANSRRLLDFAAALGTARFDPSHPKGRITEALIKLRAQGKQPPQEREKTQLTAVVEHLAELARNSGRDRPFRLWLPVLPTRLYWEDVRSPDTGRFDGTRWPEPDARWTLATAVGLYDDPANQAQRPFVLDLAETGHLAVCGSVVSGKSTFLQTFLFGLVEQYGPDQVNLYILDYSNRALACFDGLCHVGGVACEDEPDKTAKFFALITAVLAQRKKLFQGGGFSQYRKVHGPVAPAIVVVIDNFANFKEKTENKFEDILLTLSREGVNHGIFLVIAAGGFGAAEIQNRIADNIRTVVCLELGDRFKYADVLRTMHFDVLPEANVKGRGLAAVGGSILEYQTALALEADDDYARSEKMVRRFGEMNRAWTGKRARRIPSIPEQPVWADLLQADGAAELYEDGSLLPYGWYSRDASIAAVDLSRTYCWLITGRGRTGKSNLLKALASSAARLGSERYVFDLGGDGLKRFSRENGARYVDGAREMFDALKELLDVFRERNGKKRELVQAGLDEEEIYQQMRAFPPIFLFIDHLSAFVSTAYRPPEGVGAMSGFLENMMEKGFLHNIYVFAAVDVSDVSGLVGRKMFEAMTGCKTGIHLGGNAAGQRIFDFSSLPYTEQSKATRPGLGLLPPGEYGDGARQVTIPQVKG